MRHGVLRPLPHKRVHKHTRTRQHTSQLGGIAVIPTAHKTDLARGAATGSAARMHCQFQQLGNDAGEYVIPICDAAACHPLILGILIYCSPEVCTNKLMAFCNTKMPNAKFLFMAFAEVFHSRN